MTYADQMVRLDRLVSLVHTVTDVESAIERRDRAEAKEPTLWDQPPSQPTATSKAAATEIAPAAANLRERVFGWLELNGPATDEAIANGCALNPSTERPRRIELVAMGRVRSSLHLGVTSSGRKALLWETIPTTQQDGYTDAE